MGKVDQKSSPGQGAAAAGKQASLVLEEFLPYRLNVLASVVSQGLARIYAERHGIGIPEWRVIATLGQHETMTAKAIGIDSFMHKTMVSRAVAALEARKLVRRKANRKDMREAFLSLTPEGEAIYADLVPIALSYVATLTRDISPADLVHFGKVMQALVQAGRAMNHGKETADIDG